MKITFYIIGAGLVIAGVLFGLFQLGVPPVWILVAGLIAGGIAITSITGKVISSKTTESSGNETTTEKTTVVE